MYFVEASTFFGHTYFYPKKWFYFVHVTGAVLQINLNIFHKNPFLNLEVLLKDIFEKCLPRILVFLK